MIGNVTDAAPAHQAVMTRLWLVRHAPVAGATGIIHPPEAPADLTDTHGLDRIRLRLPAAAPAFCSPWRRTMETAAALGLEAVPMAALCEQSFGAWSGRRHDDLAGEADYKTFWDNPAENRAPGGESFCDQVARVSVALSALPPGDVVLVVHSGTIRALLAIALDLPTVVALRFVVDPLSLTRLDRLEAAWRVVAVNTW